MQLPFCLLWVHFRKRIQFFLQIKNAIVAKYYTSSTCGNSSVYIRVDVVQELMQLQEITPVCALCVLCLVALGVSGRGDYFFEPVINITQPNQVVKVDGCATPTQ